jgi:hypothetical protein
MLDVAGERFERVFPERPVACDEGDGVLERTRIETAVVVPALALAKQSPRT